MTPYVEALLTVGGAAGALTAVIALLTRIMPVLKMNGRVRKNEARIDALESGLREMREETRNADRVIVRGIIAVSDNLITGNSREQLKATKNDLLDFLQEH